MSGACTIDGCNRPYLARGFCGMHWRRWSKGRDPTVKSHFEKTAAERFWEKVEKRGPDDCWLWTGPKRGNKPLQYGVTHVNGAAMSAHRFAYLLQVGELPALEDADVRGTCVRHTCDNTLCQNGRHLVPGTHQQNMQDKVDRCRTARYLTHCKRGHPRTPENIYQTKQGQWQCRACRRKEQRTF